MRIGGFQKLTLIDFPGLVAAIVFTQGCNFRCRFCHNPELVLPELFRDPLAPEEILEYLRNRQGRLEGVVITGGEPTIQEGLADFITRVKELGYALKLDTNGSHPEVLSSLLASKLLDYIAMDVKSSLENYPRVTAIDCDTAKIKESIDLIINSGVPYQFRTTLVKGLCPEEELMAIQPLIAKANHYVLQSFASSPNIMDPRFGPHSQYTNAEMDALKVKYEKHQGDRSGL